MVVQDKRLIDWRATRQGEAFDVMEPEWIARLLDRHAAALALYSRQFCDAPDDVVQEAFLKLSGLDQIPDDPASWLFRVARNLAIDAARAAGRRRRHETRAAALGDEWFDPATGSGAAEVDPEEAGRALADLPVEQREVVVARIWGGLTFEQIAEVSGGSSSTAHRLYARGLETLRQRLGAPCRGTRRNPN